MSCLKKRQHIFQLSQKLGEPAQASGQTSDYSLEGFFIILNTDVAVILLCKYLLQLYLITISNDTKNRTPPF